MQEMIMNKSCTETMGQDRANSFLAHPRPSVQMNYHALHLQETGFDTLKDVASGWFAFCSLAAEDRCDPIRTARNMVHMPGVGKSMRPRFSGMSQLGHVKTAKREPVDPVRDEGP
jgi:hypothetical protein